MERQRRLADAGEFQDPLKNYDPPVFEDALERSLSEDTIEAMTIRPFYTVPRTMSVADAMKVMVDKDIACLMITEDGKLLGIFSERDVLNKVADFFERIKDAPIGAVMTANPLTVYVTESPAAALNVMAMGGFRHVPILDVDDKVVGILGPRRITNYVQKFLDA